MKQREGLEQTRVRSQRGVVASSMFTTIATLLIEMAGTRRKNQKKDDEQIIPLQVIQPMLIKVCLSDG